MIGTDAGEQGCAIGVSNLGRTLIFATSLFLACHATASAQEGPSQASTESEDQGAVLELPLIGDIQLPSWLSFLGTSDASSNEGGNADASSGGSGGGGQAQGEGQGQGAGGGEGSSQPPAVVVTRAELQSVGEELEFIGTIEAIENVTLQARVNGFIEEVFFQGGDTVSVGERLFKIEDDQYQASLNAAQAQLAGAQAQFAEAERSLARAQELIDSGTIPQAQLDNARATYESAQATKLQAEAQVRQAQLNLDYTSITAPIDGVISAPMITRGNYVSAASGTLAEIVQLDPIWGNFPIGENRLAEWRRIGQGDRDAAERQSADDFRLGLILPNDETYQQDGSFAFVGNTVDPSTGTIEVRVRFGNEDGRLLPNENVRLRASEKEPPMLPVVPMAAIQLNREGRTLFVLNETDDTVSRRVVETGKQMRGNVAIQSGIEAGELVVVQGVQNLQDGAKVNPNFEEGSEGPGGPIRDGEDGGEPAGQTPEAGQSGESGAQGAADAGEGTEGDQAANADSGSQASSNGGNAQ
ncbi:efflux RND transporter periplasmic adaptor subunit [Fulvimarina endophytica]|uniref:Efflux RND transporter periplasmic adaptor subunit n=1 Tax=Fulvimarina endophytica TaxID=2293836 RepID=A0A371X0V7_9HYPH|nr:efflux RND transporter periplasmic adaptor subunit [Fulvimarina endophytica]RFC62859.1 efflux RND transporter periplasmic adaptor subunit [Fulvimarina endophytica]